MALLTAMLLNAETTKVFSYNGTIDDRVNESTQADPPAMAPEGNQTISQKQEEKDSEQAKWNNLSDQDRQKIEDQRTQKRSDGIEHINQRLTDLDNDSQKLSDNRGGMTQVDYKDKETTINEKKACLSEMKTHLEQAPVGENVNLYSPLAEENEIISSSVSRH